VLANVEEAKALSEARLQRFIDEPVDDGNVLAFLCCKKAGERKNSKEEIKI
jgi:hypothetical protein